MREVVAVAAATAALRRAKQAQLGVDEPRARRHLQVSKIEAEVAHPLPHVLVGENHELVVVDGVVAVRQRARHRGEHDSALHTLPRRQTPGGPVGPHQRRAGQAGCALQPTRAPRSRSLPGQAGLARRPRDHPAHASGERGGDEEQAPHLAEHLFLVVGLRCCCRPASFERRESLGPQIPCECDLWYEFVLPLVPEVVALVVRISLGIDILTLRHPQHFSGKASASAARRKGANAGRLLAGHSLL